MKYNRARPCSILSKESREFIFIYRITIPTFRARRGAVMPQRETASPHRYLPLDADASGFAMSGSSLLILHFRQCAWFGAEYDRRNIADFRHLGIPDSTFINRTWQEKGMWHPREKLICFIIVVCRKYFVARHENCVPPRGDAVVAADKGWTSWDNDAAFVAVLTHSISILSTLLQWRNHTLRRKEKKRRLLFALHLLHNHDSYPSVKEWREIRKCCSISKMAEFASGNLETLTFKLTYLCTVYLFLSCTGSAMFTRSTVGCLSPTKTPIKRTKIAPKKDEQRREAGTNCAGINKRDNLMQYDDVIMQIIQNLTGFTWS